MDVGISVDSRRSFSKKLDSHPDSKSINESIHLDRSNNVKGRRNGDGLIR